MLASAPLGQQRCAQPHTQLGFKHASLPVRPARSGRRTGSQPVNSLAMGISSSSAAQIGVLSNVASATIVALGALWWVQQNRAEVRSRCLVLPSHLPSAAVGPSCQKHALTQISLVQTTDADPECPTCEGTGYTDCICHRWNDGDVGCSSCGGTGKLVRLRSGVCPCRASTAGRQYQVNGGLCTIDIR